MTRLKFREHIFKILFKFEFHDREEFDKQQRLYLDGQADVVDEDEVDEKFVLTEEDKEEIILKTNAIVSNIDEIDDIIRNNCEGWSIERIGRAELAILRTAIYEIKFDDTLDKAISINEAVNIAKKFCDEKAYSFINGVLAKIQ